MGPRNPDEPIGEFPALAFVLNRRFKPTASATTDGSGAGGNPAQNSALAAL